MKALAGRWSAVLIETLHFAAEPLRFAQIRRRCGISQKELARPLDVLAREGVVQRRAGAGRWHACELIDCGRALPGVTEAIGRWGAPASPAHTGPATWLDPLGYAPDVLLDVAPPKMSRNTP